MIVTTSAAAIAPRFELGRVVITRSAIDAMSEAFGDAGPEMTAALLRRHHAGDFGDLEADDLKANRDAIRFGDRIVSSYDTPALIGEDDRAEKLRVWIITEGKDDDEKRASTCIMLPADY